MKYLISYYWNSTPARETEYVPVDPEQIPWPSDAIAYQLFSYKELNFEGETIITTPLPVGKRMFHPDSIVEHRRDAVHNPNTTPALLANMRRFSCESVLWTRYGKAQLFIPAMHEVAPKEVTNAKVIPLRLHHR